MATMGAATHANWSRMWKTSARSRLKLARSERFAYDADGEGHGRAFKKKSLKVMQERIYLDEIGLERWTAPGDHCCFLWAGSDICQQR